MGDEEVVRNKITTLKAVISDLSRAKDEFLIKEQERILSDKAVNEANINKVMPYLYSGILLSLSAKEINEENITKIFDTINLKTNKEILSMVLNAKARAHVPYLNAYYFLLAMGKSGTKDEILNVVKALGLNPDKARLEDVLSFLKLV